MVPAAPTTIPSNTGPNQRTAQEDRHDDPTLQGRGYLEYFFTDTTIVIEQVLQGPAALAGRSIVNRTIGDGIHACTSGDPPAAPDTLQLFFLVRDRDTDSYFTTTSSLYGRFAITDGRISLRDKPAHAQQSAVAQQLDGKTLVELRALL